MFSFSRVDPATSLTMARNPFSKPKMKPRINTTEMVGKTYHYLSVLEVFITGSRTFCHCFCMCGNRKSVRADALKRGQTTSCGCQRGNPAPDQPLISRIPVPKAPKPPKTAKIPRKRPAAVKITIPDIVVPPVTSTITKATIKTIKDSRASGTRWAEIADLVGLSVNDCRFYAELP